MKSNSRAKLEKEFRGDINLVRDVEDCIRITKKYTIGKRTPQDTTSSQGEKFPSKAFCMHYEVYPDAEIGIDMPIGTALKWYWRSLPCIDVIFKYDYRDDADDTKAASVTIKDGVKAIGQLARAIPNFSKALGKVRSNGQEN